MVNDAARAYSNAHAVCAEDPEEGDEDRCGELLVSMYRTRPAALNWQRCYTKLLAHARFRVTKACSRIVRQEDRDIDLIVRGENFVIIRDHQYLLWLKSILAVRQLSGIKGDAKEVKGLSCVRYGNRCPARIITRPKFRAR